MPAVLPDQPRQRVNAVGVSVGPSCFLHASVGVHRWNQECGDLLMFATRLDAGTPALLSLMIKRAFGTGAAKKASPYADASDRTVSDWLQRRAEPGAWKLLRMLRHPGFRAELRAYIDHIEKQEAAIASELERIAAARLRGDVGAAVGAAGSDRLQAVGHGDAGAGAERRAVGQ